MAGKIKLLLAALLAFIFLFVFWQEGLLIALLSVAGICLAGVMLAIIIYALKISRRLKDEDWDENP